MNRYSDMTIWQLCQEREAIETELATRYTAPRPKSEPNAALGMEHPNAAGAGPAPAAPGVASMVKRLDESYKHNTLLLIQRQEWTAMRSTLLARLGQGWIPEDALSFCEDCGMYVVSKPGASDD